MCLTQVQRLDNMPLGYAMQKQDFHMLLVGIQNVLTSVKGDW